MFIIKHLHLKQFLLFAIDLSFSAPSRPIRWMLQQVFKMIIASKDIRKCGKSGYLCGKILFIQVCLY